MKVPLWISLALTWGAANLHAEDAPKADGIAIAIHDSEGLSPQSAHGKNLSMVLFKPHTNIHLKISNTSGKALNLWQPNCPPGDRMRIEFREPGAPEKVLTASPQWCYTGGMGLPKMLTLAAGDDILVNVDIVDWWAFPVQMNEDTRKEMEVRAVYESSQLEGISAKTYADIRERSPEESPPAESVWVGVAASPWSKVTISNRTGKAVGPQATAENQR